MSRKALTLSSLLGLFPQHKHLPKSFLIQAVSTRAALSQSLTWLYSSTDNPAVCGQGSLNWAVKLPLWVAVLYVNRLAERKADIEPSKSKGKKEWGTLKPWDNSASPKSKWPQVSGQAQASGHLDLRFICSPCHSV